MKPVRCHGVPVWLGLLWSLLFFCGSAWAGSDRTYEKIDVFSQVLHYVQNSYVERVETKRIIYGAIRGMLKTLDPHTVFMSPEEFQSMQEDTSGHFGGVGIDLVIRDGLLTVVAPIDGTPAARAGLQPGDRLVKIDGVSAVNIDILDASRRIKGVPGTKVVLTVDRDDFEKPKDFILIRQRIRLNPVDKFMPFPGYGVLKIRSFQERTERYMLEALSDLKAQAGGKLKGLVLDLRNNPGGLLGQAVRVADRFIPEGVIVETKGRGEKIERDVAHKKGTEPSYPMICLINRGSASASEIVAGALQDHGRALVMGTRSFGKGSVQTVVGLKDGSGLKLTIARYFTPKHRSIQKQGIVPDVKVPSRPPKAKTAVQAIPQEDRLAPLKKDIIGASLDSKLREIEDFQLRTALDYLRSWEQLQAGRRPKIGGHPSKNQTAINQ